MKVLKEGPGWSVEQTCTGYGNGGGGCGALLAVEREDIYQTSRTDYTGDTDYFWTFKCPCCGVETDIPDKLVPSGVRNLARGRRR